MGDVPPGSARTSNAWASPSTTPSWSPGSASCCGADPGAGGLSVVGVAPGTPVIPVKVLGDDGSGYTSGIIAGINWVIARGDINVASMSLGGGYSQAVPLEDINLHFTGDLHAITPSRYLEFGGGVLNELSYQQARNYSVPIGGVYVSAPGYSLGNARISAGSIITEVDGVDVPTLSAFEKEMSSKPDGSRVPVRYYSLSNPRTTAVSVVRVDRRCFTMQRCIRDDALGRWPCSTPKPCGPWNSPSARAKAGLPASLLSSCAKRGEKIIRLCCRWRH